MLPRNSSSLFHLKEYTAYEYSQYIAGTYTCQQSLTIEFKNASTPTPTITTQLKGEIIDKMNANEEQKMYICKWEYGKNKSAELKLFQFRQCKNVVKFNFNVCPKFVCIVDDCLYVLGGSEIVVIYLNKLEIIARYSIGPEIVHAMEPALKEDDINHKGVALYSWNDRLGYRKRFFSHKFSTQDKWLAIKSTIFMKKAPQQLVDSELKIIIPNVVGLLILNSKKQICLMNLSTMEPILHTKNYLTSWAFEKPSRAIIKYYVNKSSKIFDDSLLISIAQKDKENIETFVFHIKYVEQIALEIREIKEQRAGYSIGLPSISSGDAVDWNSSILQTFLTYCTEGQLVDFLLTQNGIIFISNSMIKVPIAGFISYKSPLCLNPILSLQHGIWRSFLQDTKIHNLLQQLQSPLSSPMQSDKQIQYYHTLLLNSILQTNRYSTAYLQGVLNISSLTQLNPKQIKPFELLRNWLKLYRIKQILIFDGDILIMRDNSITSLLEIQESHYLMDVQNWQCILEYYRSYGDKQGVWGVSVGESQYQMMLAGTGDIDLDNVWERQAVEVQKLGFLYEKSGISLKHDQTQRVIKYEQIYTKYFSRFLKNLQFGYHPQSLSPQSLSSLSQKSFIFSPTLLQNRLKDVLLHNSRTLKYLFSKSMNLRLPLQANNNFNQLNIIHYLSVLQKIILQCYTQYCSFGIDLLGMFIKGESKEEESYVQGGQYVEEEEVQKVVNIDYVVWKIMGKLFNDLVVVRNQHRVNSFIKLLLNHIKSGYEQISNLLLQQFCPNLPNYSNWPINMQNNSDFESSRQSLYPCNVVTVQECYHYPPSASLLSIYCYLPFSANNEIIRTRLITGLMLKLFGAKRNSESEFNQFLSNVVAPNSTKDKISEIYMQVKGENKPDQYSLSLGTQSSQAKVLSHSSYPISESSKLKNLPSATSHTINHLSKIYEPQDIEKMLKDLSLDQLSHVFRMPLEQRVMQSIGKSKKYELAQIKCMSIEDVVTNEVYKFRVYVLKFKELIAEIHNKTKQENMRQAEAQRIRDLSIKNIKHCINALGSVKNYYKLMYEKSRQIKLDQDKKNVCPFQLTDEQAIQKVCCRMLGYSNSQTMLLYSKKDNSCKVLPTERMLKILLQIMQSQHSYIETITSFESVAFYCLEQILERPGLNLPKLEQLCKYISRRELFEMIVKNGILRAQFQKLDNSSPTTQFIKMWFPYFQSFGVVGDHNYDKQTFRNAYLEATGH